MTHEVQKRENNVSEILNKISEQVTNYPAFLQAVANWAGIDRDLFTQMVIEASILINDGKKLSISDLIFSLEGHRTNLNAPSRRQIKNIAYNFNKKNKGEMSLLKLLEEVVVKYYLHFEN